MLTPRVTPRTAPAETPLTADVAAQEYLAHMDSEARQPARKGALAAEAKRGIEQIAEGISGLQIEPFNLGVLAEEPKLFAILDGTGLNDGPFVEALEALYPGISCHDFGSQLNVAIPIEVFLPDSGEVERRQGLGAKAIRGCHEHPPRKAE